MNEEILLKEAEEFVTEVFSSKVATDFFFHNISHTHTVVAAAKEMAEHYNLTPQDRLPLLLAAWFHDTGYSKGQAHNHEEESVIIAESFLKTKQVEADTHQKMRNCIMATKMPQSPTTLIEQILCDSDLSHLGSGSYADENKLLRKEINAVYNKDLSKKEWRKLNKKFLEAHHYFTDYAKQVYGPPKQAHLHEINERLGEKDVHDDTLLEKLKEKSPITNPVSAKISPTQAKEKAKENRTERGIGTMFRIMSDNHVNLSQMADSKANIMISVNTIVLSILVSVLLGKLQYYPQFIIPTILLASISLLAIIFAILATRPNVTRGTFTEEDVKQKKVNLLFFGNFHKMELKDYDWGMKEMMNDREYLYGSMIKDIYFLGKVLAKKYHYLRLSYTVFMFGLIVSMVAFVIAAIVGSGH